MKYDVSGRGVASVARATAMAVALCFGAALTPGMAADQSPTPAPAMTPAPVAAPKGEFDNSCAMGLASGQVVKTDCSVNWTAPDGKVYCFSTEDSKDTFLKNPDENIQKAKEFFLAKDLSQDKAPLLPQPAAGGRRGCSQAHQDVHRGRRECGGEAGDRAAEQGRRLRVPRSQARSPTSISIFDQIKIVRGMEGYGWFANIIFHDKDEPKKQYAIDFWFKPEGQTAEADGHPRAEGAEAGGRQLGHDHAPAGGLVVAPSRGAPGRHGGDPRLAGDGRDPQLHRHA